MCTGPHQARAPPTRRPLRRKKKHHQIIAGGTRPPWSRRTRWGPGGQPPPRAGAVAGCARAPARPLAGPFDYNYALSTRPALPSCPRCQIRRNALDYRGPMPGWEGAGVSRAGGARLWGSTPLAWRAGACERAFNYTPLAMCAGRARSGGDDA